MLLFAHRWRDESRSLLSWLLTVGLVTFGALLLSTFLGDLRNFARALQEWLAEAPPMVRSLIGGELPLAQPIGFVLGTVINSIIPLLGMIYATSAAADIYAREASRGTLEFLFSLPMKRLHLAGGRLRVFLANLASLHAAVYLAAAAGLLVIGGTVDWAWLAWAMGNQYLLHACLGGLVFLLSLLVRDYHRTQLIGLGVFLGLFVLQLIQENPQGLAWLNPYAYYRGKEIIFRGLVPWRDLAVLAGAASLFWIGGIRLFCRRQI